MKTLRIKSVNGDTSFQDVTLSIDISVDTFVNEKGEELAKIPNQGIWTNKETKPIKNRDTTDLQVDMNIEKGHTIEIGDEIKVTIKAKNNGPIKATDIYVYDILPDGYEIKNITQTKGDVEDRQWKIKELEVNQEEKLVITAQVLESGEYQHKVKISSNEYDRYFSNNEKRSKNRVYVIKTILAHFDSGVPSVKISRKERDETEKFIIDNRHNYSAFTPDCIAYKNSIEIHSEKSTRERMVKIVEQDDGKGGRKDENNKEYGGAIDKNGQIYNEAEGPVTDPSKDNFAYVQIERYIGDSTFHSHPSGELSEEANKIYSGVGSSATISFGEASSNRYIRYSNAPSYKFEAIISGKKQLLGDVGSIQNDEDKGVIKYVFARRNKIVYIYNYKGVLATIPHEFFVNFKKIK